MLRQRLIALALFAAVFAVTILLLRERSGAPPVDLPQPAGPASAALAAG